jgi:hypothetical protein
MFLQEIVDISNFDTVEGFCKKFCFMNGILKLDMCFENWTDCFRHTFIVTVSSKN